MRYSSWPRRAVLSLSVLFVALLVAPEFAAASHRGVPGLPPTGKKFLGVYSADERAFQSRVGRRHPIHATYFTWGKGVGPEGGRSIDSYMQQAKLGNFTWQIHIGTGRDWREAISPGEIARGMGDEYLIGLSAGLNNANRVVYIRPMAEMNGWWNFYSAFNQNGTRRDADHSTWNYRRAFARMALILRGGSVAQINRKLADRKIAPLRTDRRFLPHSGKVAIIWNPQGAGSPNVRGNAPKDYFPGYGVVDWIGIDIFSINRNAYWRGMVALYKRYPRKPFMVAEWAPWGIDDAKFVETMFRFAHNNPRVRMLVYYASRTKQATFDLHNKPRALAQYRRFMRLAEWNCPRTMRGCI